MTVTPRSPFAPTDQDGNNAVRRSLVLAGGGMRVAYQAGALAALEEAGLRFHHAGRDVGGDHEPLDASLRSGQRRNGRALAHARPPLFSTLYPWLDYVRTPRWPGLGSARGLREKVFPHLGIDADPIRRSRGISGTYNVCNFAAKTAEVVDHTEVDLDLLVAAVSLPGLMPVVVRSGTPYTDAVWVRDSNVPEAVRRGSDEVWLVWCIGNTGVYHNGLFRQYVHMIETAANGSLGRDLGYIEAKWPERPVRLHVIKPQHPLPLDTAYYFGRVDASAFIDFGYQDACRYLNDPTPLTAPWDQSVTEMSEAPPGATVRLVLGGPFALGDHSAVEGARVGAQEGTSVALHLQIQARNRQIQARNRQIQTRNRQVRPRGRTGGENAGPFSVAGDVSLPGQRAHTLIEEGTVELAADGFRLCVGWRSCDQARSLVVAPTGQAGVLAVTVTARPDQGPERPPGRRPDWRPNSGPDWRPVGAGTVALGWREAARALASLHATDCSTTAEAATARAILGLDVLRLTGPFSSRAATGQGATGQGATGQGGTGQGGTGQGATGQGGGSDAR